jgi:fused signal recognition particle receptor
MFKFLKSNKDPSAPVPEKTGLFARLRSGLKRTRQQFAEGLTTLFLGKKVIDATLLTEIETQLLLADVGVEVSSDIIKKLTQQIAREALNDPQELLSLLKTILAEILQPCSLPLVIDGSQKPTVILMVGVNGSGKTTTIGKLAKKFTDEGKKVLLAAGDTFRAAAVEQLKVWGDRNNVPVIAQQPGADSASVIFDALQAAQARGVDVLIADTAGRLQSQGHLMEELKKIKRVLTKLDPNAPHEVMLVLDATVGQNGLQQAQQFFDAVKVSGITITKLDGTAKGGILFAIAKQLATPIRFIGVGESVEDLQAFDSDTFIEALFTPQTEMHDDSL